MVQGHFISFPAEESPISLAKEGKLHLLNNCYVLGSQHRDMISEERARSVSFSPEFPELVHRKPTV